jgi:urease accessory protein
MRNPRPAIAAARALFLVAGAGADAAHAHGFAPSGWVHPLTGIDHILAMLAVGAWSAQLGGRAIALVPAAFVSAMGLGGIMALRGSPLPGTESIIAFSVIALGLAIAIDRTVAGPAAAMATAMFGLAHGSAHGGEAPLVVDPLSYVVGFVVATAGLHVLGAVAALLLLERSNGQMLLRGPGLATAIAGAVLAARLVAFR